jgi:FtsH-binding integral membrane protein
MSHGAGWEVRRADRALPAERLDFIRKVYSLFFAALLVASGGVYVGFTNPATFIGARWALFIGTIVLLLVVGFSKTARRTKPWNYFLLFGVNFLVCLTIGPWVALVEAAGKGWVLAQAFVMAAGIFGGLTAYAWLSKKDFSFLGGFLTVGILGLLIAGLVYAFMPGAHGLGFVIACVGVLIMAGFTLYDTSQIVHRYDTDEYVAGALDLFMDFYLLFWYIAQLFLGTSRD